MRLEYSTQPYQWRDGDAWMVGRKVLCSGESVTRLMRLDGGEQVTVVQMQVACDGGLCFVPFHLLEPYGPPAGAKIPEPTK